MSGMEIRDRRRSFRRLHLLGWWLAAVAFLVIWLYLPLPYYVTRPGSAIALGPIVEVEGGEKEEAGSFMLTTVRMGEATPVWYVYSLISPEVDLIDRGLVLGHGETNEEFTRRELEIMRNSQELAEAIAFQRAGYRVKMEKQGVVVLGTLDGTQARDVFRVGDVITAVDGNRTPTTQDLLRQLENRKPGDRVTVTYVRDGKENAVEMELAALPDESVSRRAGLGIRQPQDKLSIEIPRRVTISSESIGGPSAGLMFTLEIYNQLRKDIDLTRGYRVAGTGTINPDGMVGRIGGIRHKVIAADRAGAELFLAPMDGDNYEEAKEAAREIGTAMRIVPVSTVDEAIRYLTSLPPKSP